MARDDFAQLRDGKKMPEVRHELLTTLKAKLVPLGVLDEFKSAGVFVNWWQQIRYDLKTIVSTGWHHTLIPDDYLIAEFFQTEADAIEALEAKISEAQGELAEAVETAQEVAAYEPEEDETVTAAVIKKALKELIDDLETSTGASAKKELEALTKQDKAIKAIEARIRETKATLAAFDALQRAFRRLGTPYPYLPPDCDQDIRADFLVRRYQRIQRKAVEVHCVPRAAEEIWSKAADHDEGRPSSRPSAVTVRQNALPMTDIDASVQMTDGGGIL